MLNIYSHKSNFKYYFSDEVRPPIPPVRQVLVQDYPSGPYNFRRNVPFDAFRNFEQETRKYDILSNYKLIL